MLENANSATYKINGILFENFSQSTKFGVAFRQRKCTLCKRYLTKEMQPNEILNEEMSVEVIDEDDDVLG